MIDSSTSLVVTFESIAINHPGLLIYAYSPRALSAHASVSSSVFAVHELL